MERSVSIPISGSKLEIEGTLRGAFASPLAILAPGLGGWQHDLLLFNASRYFEQKGISTLRLSFYGDGASQRDIGDFDVKLNAADIDAAVDYSKNQGTEWICVIGHSYSGMAIVYSKKQAFDTAVLWDASHTDGYKEVQSKTNLAKDFIYTEEFDSYISAKGPGYVLSRKVFENYSPGSAAMARSFRIDTLVVNAADSGDAMRRFGRSYANNINAETAHVVIPGASHPFTEDGAMERLFEVTARWMLNKIASEEKGEQT